MNKDVLVSVWVIAYNHEKYIATALDSILNQVYNFKIEIVIGEDCSPDNTRAIIKKYEQQYPEIIKPIYNEKNMGDTLNSLNSVKACKGKYIAVLEGDDFWTDTHKLQKQVDFMEANPQYALCFTKVGIVDEIGLQHPNPYPDLTKDTYTLEDIINAKKCFIPTPSLFFRNILPVPPPQFAINAISGDISMHIMLATQGDAAYLPFQSAVYRQHPGGITKSEDHKLRHEAKLFQLYEEVNEFYEYKYNTFFKKRLFEMAQIMLIYGARNLKYFKKFAHARRWFPKYLKYTAKTNVKEIVYYNTILFLPFLLKLKKKSN